MRITVGAQPPIRPRLLLARKGETRRKLNTQFVHKVPHGHRCERHRRNRRTKRRKETTGKDTRSRVLAPLPHVNDMTYAPYSQLSVFDRLSVGYAAYGTLIHICVTSFLRLSDFFPQFTQVTVTGSSTFAPCFRSSGPKSVHTAPTTQTSTTASSRQAKFFRMPKEEVTRLEANHAQYEAAAVRVVPVVHHALRQRALAAQRGVARETGEVPQAELRALHGRHELVHYVEAPYQRVQARAEIPIFEESRAALPRRPCAGWDTCTHECPY